MHAILAMFFVVITWGLVWTWIVGKQLVIAWILAVMISYLPAPRTSYGFYAWFFGVSQFLAANLTRGKLGVQGNLRGGDGTNRQ